MMDNDKPFKTIEVIDSRTNQLCKVACMSCIRGHRTTACGIPVCRPKIFWTVKRPGRPSNSCTCRYGASGGCKCVVARSACPHKPKKGEKRSGECRCDEQGRYCCLLEPDHWTSLLSLRKPTVDFFPTREALEAKQAASANIAMPPTPSYSSITTPLSMSSVPGSPVLAPPSDHLRTVPIEASAYHPFPSFQTSLNPRFGMMGIGAPIVLQRDPPPDVLAWEGEIPLAPREYLPQPALLAPQPERRSCCQAATPPTQIANASEPPSNLSFSQNHDEPDTTLTQPYNRTANMSQLPPEPAPAYDFDKIQADYFHYQFPSAICQNCGLSGCTCRNCPPVFQNFGTTSWAQCCGRKHARDVQPSPGPQKIPRTEQYDTVSEARQTVPIPAQLSSSGINPLAVDDSRFGVEGYQDLGLAPGMESEFPAFDPLAEGLLLPEGTEHLDLSEFLLSDLTHSNSNPREPGATVEKEEDEGGGGCCCGGR